MDGEELERLVQQWLDWDRWDATRNEMIELRQKDNKEEMAKRLGKRMEFGTAGLRARMGAGNSMMNDLTIIQATQGLLSYMKQRFSHEQLNKGGIVVGFDGRHNSDRWAQRIAAIFSQAEVKVHLFSRMTPTPFVPFAINKFGCVGGVMVTASHNPKEDNGYKVYWNNGSQIIPPHDSGIALCIEANLEPWPSSWELKTQRLVADPYSFVMDHYFREIRESVGIRDSNENARSSVGIVHSAMHGVGHPFAQRIFEVFNLPAFFPVKEQKDADPEFSTVKFPNPEEGKSALDLAIQTAHRHDCRIILANDPDADRMAVAEKQNDGSWKVFTGNETAALIGWWILRNYRRKHGQEANLENCFMISSTVSSFILKSMACKEGFQFVDTLTGFKWMGNKADELLKAGKQVLFAFEEAIGFMVSPAVLDKDGISACALFGELVAELADQGLTLSAQLDNVFRQYGVHLATTSYFVSYDQQKIKGMFDRIRRLGGERGYPLECGPFPIKNIRDLTTGYDDNQPDKKAIMPTSASTQMITFHFENGGRVTLRTSGTEPKIKYYIEMIGDAAAGVAEIRLEMQNLIDSVVREWYRPSVNNFEWRKE